MSLLDINIEFTFEPAGIKVVLDSFFLRIFLEQMSKNSLNFSDCVEKKSCLLPHKVNFMYVLYLEANNRLFMFIRVACCLIAWF